MKGTVWLRDTMNQYPALGLSCHRVVVGHGTAEALTTPKYTTRMNT